MVAFIDTHCHLDLTNSIKENVVKEDHYDIKTITVTNAPFLWQKNDELFKSCKNIRVAVGMHPELVPQYYKQLDVFENCLKNSKYVGEIGLDGSLEHKGNFKLQYSTFENLLKLIKKNGNKILTIHSRNAAVETIDLLDKYLNGTNCKVIMHWYSGNSQALNRALDLGYFFSINHKMVNSIKGQDIVKKIPFTNLLTETDAPFTLTENIIDRVSSLSTTVSEIGKMKGETKEIAKAIIYNNFKNLLQSVSA